MTPLSAPILTDYTETRQPTLRTLGLRSPIERAAAVERLCGYASMQRGYLQADMRREDADRLRKRLLDGLPLARRYSAKAAMTVWCPETFERNAVKRVQIDRICKAAMRRMKRADDAYAEGKIKLTPAGLA